MSSNPFAAPAPPGEGITWQEHNGVLLLIEPAAYEQTVSTSYGDTDAVRATVTVLDGPKAGEVYEDTLIFPRLLISQTRSKINEKVLGRLGQGQAKPGQSPPWLLQEATEQDVQVGVAYLNQRQQGQIAQPAPAAQPQGDQWPQQAQQPQGQPQQQGGQVPF
jgi:hypothetical protein